MTRYVKVTITQVNWDGMGNDRSWTFYRLPSEVAEFIRQKEFAYNMAHTTITAEA